MKTTALIEKSKDGTFLIFTPDINHTIIGEGKTVQEAKKDFENSVKEVLAAYTEENKTLSKELRNISFEYKYDIASVFDYYNFINVSKFAELSGINASLMRRYKSNDVYISDKQIRRIEKTFHKISEEFASIRLS